MNQDHQLARQAEECQARWLVLEQSQLFTVLHLTTRKVSGPNDRLDQLFLEVRLLSFSFLCHHVCQAKS